MDEKKGEETKKPKDGPDGVDGLELLKEAFEAVAEAGRPQFLGFSPTDEGVSITVLPKGSDKPVTVRLRVVEVKILDSMPRTSRLRATHRAQTGPNRKL